MTNRILILGASGHIAHFAIEKLLKSTDDHLVLFTRHPQSLAEMDTERINILEGDTLSPNDLVKAMNNVNIVYANLSNPDIQRRLQTLLLRWISTKLNN